MGWWMELTVGSSCLEGEADIARREEGKDVDETGRSWSAEKQFGTGVELCIECMPIGESTLGAGETTGEEDPTAMLLLLLLLLL